MAQTTERDILQLVFHNLLIMRDKTLFITHLTYLFKTSDDLVAVQEYLINDSVLHE